MLCHCGVKGVIDGFASGFRANAELVRGEVFSESFATLAMRQELTRRLIVPPMAIGLTSPLGLLRPMSGAPASHGAIEPGPRPDAKDVHESG